jgi:hypothetical protein
MSKNLDVICFQCVHFDGILGCPAFPDGIPEEILLGENDHSQIIKGQVGKFIFEPIKEQTNELPIER